MRAMKKITLFYDTKQYNKKRKRVYHYVIKKPYNWLISDEFAEKIKEIEPPVMVNTSTRSSEKAKDTIFACYVARIVEASKDELETLKSLEHDEFIPQVWHANEEQQKRLDNLMRKLGLS